VIENNLNMDLIVSMSIKQRFRQQKRRKGKETPSILVNSNEGSFIKKSSNGVTASFYIS
jgi:hypothetical protein